MKKPFKTSRQLKRELSNKPKKPRKDPELSFFTSENHRQLTIKVFNSEIENWQKEINLLSSKDLDLKTISEIQNLQYKISNNQIKIRNVKKGLPENGKGLGYKPSYSIGKNDSKED